MAQHGDIDIPSNTWTQLTNADATTITFQNKGQAPIYIEGTTTGTAPTTVTGAIYKPLEGEKRESISTLFPGRASVRLWALALSPTTVFRSHD